jgi:transketolase
MTTASRPMLGEKELRALAARVRVLSLRMVARQGFGYLGQALSSAELFAVIYGDLLRAGRDRFVLSPGHYATPYYAAAVACELLDPQLIETYGDDGAQLEAIGSERTPGLDFTCGSLGQGLSVAVGLALGDRLAGEERRTIAFLSDGELEEGQVWEAAMFADHHVLDSLLVVLDANGSQVDGPIETVTTVEPIAAKWEAFGWCAIEADGHDVTAVREAMRAAIADERPAILVARTDILGRVAGLPADTDGHFVKITPAVTAAVLAASAVSANA